MIKKETHRNDSYISTYIFQPIGVFETLLINGCLPWFLCSSSIKNCFPKIYTAWFPNITFFVKFFKKYKNAANLNSRKLVSV